MCVSESVSVYVWKQFPVVENRPIVPGLEVCFPENFKTKVHGEYEIQME